MELNELNRRANGGTEQVHRALEAKINPDILSKVQLIPSRVRDIDANRAPVLVLHDLPSDPESAHLGKTGSQDRFRSIVCVSHWQANMYNLVLNVPFSKLTVLPNAIEPFGEVDKPKDGIVRLIYHTTPHRGLGIVVPVFEYLSTIFDNIELDVYSSFSIYGWEERDAPFKELFDRCRAHPKIRYHGAVPNAEVREALKKADIFAYPSVWPETSCIAAIEALAAGCVMVCPSYAALPETTAPFSWMYPFTESGNDHAQRFLRALGDAIATVTAHKGEQGFQGRLNFQAHHYNTFYSWENRIPQWEQHLSSII